MEVFIPFKIFSVKMLYKKVDLCAQHQPPKVYIGPCKKVYVPQILLGPKKKTAPPGGVSYLVLLSRVRRRPTHMHGNTRWGTCSNLVGMS